MDNKSSEKLSKLKKLLKSNEKILFSSTEDNVEILVDREHLEFLKLCLTNHYELYGNTYFRFFVIAADENPISKLREKKIVTALNEYIGGRVIV